MSRYPYLHMKTTVTNLPHRVTFGHFAHVWMTVAHDFPTRSPGPELQFFPEISQYR
jgi:hypothetical protein